MKNILIEALVNSATNAFFIYVLSVSAKLSPICLSQTDIDNPFHYLLVTLLTAIAEYQFRNFL